MNNKFRMMIIFGEKGEVIREGYLGVFLYVGIVYFFIYILCKLYVKNILYIICIYEI